MIYLAADHRGFQLKKFLKKYLFEAGYEVEDVGALSYDQNDDYTDFAEKALKKISANIESAKGILICGSGHGMDIAANKYKGIKAVLAFNTSVAKQSREHEDANVLILASDWIGKREAKEFLETWLKTPFTGEERHIRRLKKIREIEEQNFK